MPWAKLDDCFYDNPKVILAGNATDGKVRHPVLARMRPDRDPVGEGAAA